MLKRKLPKDWITVNSKSHPDRVYYFNVKTNQSSWIQPTLDEAGKTSLVNECKIHEEEIHPSAMTPERNVEKKEISNRRRSYDKILDTPQMKALKAKVLQRLEARNKSSPSSLEVSYARTVETKRRSFPPRNSSSKLRDDTSVTSRDKNDNKVIFTPQMRVLYERIEQRISNVSSRNKTLKEDAKNKQQSVNIANQKSTKTWEKQEKNTGDRESIAWDKHDIKQRNKNQNVQESSSRNVSREKGGKLFPKKNLAKERMQRIRKNLNIDKEKIQEMCRADLVSKKPSQKFRKDNDNLGSTCIYKNVDVRLKRLHNKILKDAIYERNFTSNDDKSQNQQSNRPVAGNDKVMTKDKLIEQAEREVLYEEMDWEPMKDEEIALEVEVVRTQIDKDNVETDYISKNIVDLTQSDKTESHEKGPLHIVVDTNVFLSNLEIIEKARDATFKNYPRPFIVIPWTVICELDYFKDNKSKHELSLKARKAISFIHDQFSSKHPRIIGQTREQAAKNKKEFSLDCPDDEILQCCLQIHQLGKSVVLLSYDKNLCTKAMIYNILALGRNDPLEKIDYLDTSGIMVNNLNDGPVEKSLFNDELRLTDDIFEDAKLIVKNFLSTIITKQMSEIYGEAEWKIYVIIKPPWTAITALKCAIKHWIAAINESFQRRAEYILKELLDAFLHIPVGGRKLQDVEYILEKCSDLVQMVNMDKHCDLMTQTFSTITELKEKCKKCIADINLKKLHDKIGVVENVQEQEMRAEKVFQCFQHIYNYTRDMCGLACNNAGMAYSFTFNSIDPPLTQASVQRLQSEITRKVTDLTQNLNKLLVQADDSIKYQTLLSLQQNLSTFLPDTERITFDVVSLDIYCCVKLKQEALKTGLRQLQELTSHFCALAAHS
ncbi:uncharacterized protein Swt1 [Temnothorax nylanderi]|uniref:uncharacterized protein Swt1 n=1 Tax=Temnothorax nylanderi TaxID=102681 RepID=UPI003A8914F5